MNVTGAQSIQSTYNVYDRQSSKPATQLSSRKPDQTDSVTFSNEATAMGYTYSEEAMALCLPDWYSQMSPDVVNKNLSDHEIGTPYIETKSYEFSQLPSEDQTSISEYRNTLLTFFQEEVKNLCGDGQNSYANIRNSTELKDAVMARFNSDANATQLIERMKELGQLEADVA